MPWLRVADILSLHYDLVQGQHQKRRGGASIGKAITLAAANIKSRGAGVASLWNCWKAYPELVRLLLDVDHLGSAGLLWNLAGGKLTHLYKDWAMISAPDGSRRTYHRRPFAANLALPWRLR